jgi:hypothetical protein
VTVTRLLQELASGPAGANMDPAAPAFRILLRLQVTRCPRLPLCFLWLFLFRIHMASLGFGYTFTELSILSCFFIVIVKC